MFLLLAPETQTYVGSSPVTTDGASCSDASWLSFNTSAADFLYHTFIKAAVHPEIKPRQSSQLCEEWQGVAYARNKINIRAKAPT